MKLSREDASQEATDEIYDEKQGARQMESISKLFKSNIRQYGMIIALVLIMVSVSNFDRRHIAETAQYHES